MCFDLQTRREIRAVCLSHTKVQNQLMQLMQLASDWTTDRKHNPVCHGTVITGTAVCDAEHGMLARHDVVRQGDLHY